MQMYSSICFNLLHAFRISSDRLNLYNDKYTGRIQLLQIVFINGTFFFYKTSLTR